MSILDLMSRANSRPLPSGKLSLSKEAQESSKNDGYNVLESDSTFTSSSTAVSRKMHSIGDRPWSGGGERGETGGSSGSLSSQVGDLLLEDDGCDRKVVGNGNLSWKDNDFLHKAEKRGLESLHGSGGRGGGIWADAFDTVADLLRPPLLQSTLLLWGVFFSNAFIYYGVVLLTTQLAEAGTTCLGRADSSFLHDMWASASIADRANAAAANAGEASDSFFSVLLSSLAELPGLALVALIVDKIGRKKTMMYLLLLTGFSMPLLLTPALQQMAAGSEGWIALVPLYVARAGVMGAFQTLFIYAPEVYPTTVRTSGLGFANSFSRIGGILCPFVAVQLVQKCNPTLAVAVFSLLSFIAAAAVGFFPRETSQEPLIDFPSTALRRTDGRRK
eukprot:TRINITY_DN5656_c0_g1_i1.p1 TRINITY_DN5656_c0_g1~~TRINITY_DN5656_c0_g1_i1.p1  ORF type:complete len:433 (-),score=107.14 TRINITY_DN5656_c0_g1_i1:25-1191(-)